jgi:hypothetical protein
MPVIEAVPIDRMLSVGAWIDEDVQQLDAAILDMGNVNPCHGRGGPSDGPARQNSRAAPLWPTACLVAGSSPAGPTNESMAYQVVRPITAPETLRSVYVYVCHALAPASLVLHFVTDWTIFTSIADLAGSSYERAGSYRILPTDRWSLRRARSAPGAIIRKSDVMPTLEERLAALAISFSEPDHPRPAPAWSLLDAFHPCDPKLLCNAGY